MVIVRAMNVNFAFFFSFDFMVTEKNSITLVSSEQIFSKMFTLYASKEWIKI